MRMFTSLNSDDDDDDDGDNGDDDEGTLKKKKKKQKRKNLDRPPGRVRVSGPGLPASSSPSLLQHCNIGKHFLFQVVLMRRY